MKEDKDPINLVYYDGMMGLMEKKKCMDAQNYV